ncbi:hypothetical protein SOVF_164220 [Spinacia oleracea]|nr:hypothetical protein SOVF_164220 [Spinacia oleracea]
MSARHIERRVPTAGEITFLGFVFVNELNNKQLVFGDVYGAGSLLKQVELEKAQNVDLKFQVPDVGKAIQNFIHDEDIRLDTIKARFRNVIKRHAEWTERLSRHSKKPM